MFLLLHHVLGFTMNKNISKYKYISVEGKTGTGKSFVLSDFVLFFAMLGDDVVIMDYSGSLKKTITRHEKSKNNRKGNITLYEYVSVDKMLSVTGDILILDSYLNIGETQAILDNFKIIKRNFKHIIFDVQSKPLNLKLPIQTYNMLTHIDVNNEAFVQFESDLVKLGNITSREPVFQYLNKKFRYTKIDSILNS
jgi:hypothetical protein